MDMKNDPTILDLHPLENFSINNMGTFRVVRLHTLNPSAQTIRIIDKLYCHGFASDFPMLDEDHAQIIKDGVVIGIIHNEENALIGMRALVRNWRQSIPIDRLVLPEHEKLAYSNHTVVHEAYRNTMIGQKLASHTFDWLRDEQIPGVRLSIAPDNFRNLGYTTKTGFKIEDFSPNHYAPEDSSPNHHGEEEHSFHAVYMVANPNTMYERKHEIIQDMANKRIKLFHDRIPADELKSHAMIAVQIITGEGSNHKTNNYDLFSQLLNKLKYQGVLLLRGEQIWGHSHQNSNHTYLVCERS